MCSRRARLTSGRDKGSGAAGPVDAKRQHTWSRRPLTLAPNITAPARETGSAERIMTGRQEGAAATDRAQHNGCIWSKDGEEAQRRKQMSTVSAHTHCLMFVVAYFWNLARAGGGAHQKTSCNEQMSAATHVNKFQSV